MFYYSPFQIAAFIAHKMRVKFDEVENHFDQLTVEMDT